MTLSDLYGQLFGKSSIQDGDVISMAEHGRIGGISTGQGFKYVGILNASGSIVSEFGGTGSALATVTAVQGPAGTVPWLMTLATLSVVTQPGAGALATVTAQQGSAGVSPWLVTMGTLSVIQAGSWSVNALASVPGTSNINIASSDIPLGGGTQYNNGDSAGVPIGNVMMWRQSGDNTVQSVADDNPMPVTVINSSVLPTGAATETKQDTQIALQTQLESLIDTLQELVQRLSPLAGAMANTAQLRVVATGTVTASGPITSAQSIAEKAVAGIMYTQRVAIENNTAIQSNINNAVAN